jgi:hypothetical protein
VSPGRTSCCDYVGMMVIIRHDNTGQQERVDWELLMLRDCCRTENTINEKSPSAEKRGGGVGNKKRRSRVTG